MDPNESEHRQRAAVPRHVSPCARDGVGAAVWESFGQQVLQAHHHHRATQQCTCGQLLEHCAVLAAARGHGLSTEDPTGLSTAVMRAPDRYRFGPLALPGIPEQQV